MYVNLKQPIKQLHCVHDGHYNFRSTYMAFELKQILSIRNIQLPIIFLRWNPNHSWSSNPPYIAQFYSSTISTQPKISSTPLNLKHSHFLGNYTSPMEQISRSNIHCQSPTPDENLTAPHYPSPIRSPQKPSSMRIAWLSIKPMWFNHSHMCTNNILYMDHCIPSIRQSQPSILISQLNLHHSH